MYLVQNLDQIHQFLFIQLSLVYKTGEVLNWLLTSISNTHRHKAKKQKL